MSRCPILLLLVALGTSGCETVERALRSVHTESYPSGKILKEGPLKGGEQQGEWTYYHETGQLKAKGSYLDDLQVGRWTYWYANGVVEMDGVFADERRSGLWRYFHRNGSPRAIGRFDHGRETGQWTFWDPQGERSQRGDYFQGQPALGWTHWYPGGAKKAEGYYYAGAKVGVWNFWDRDGTVSAKTYPLPDGVAFVRETWEDGAVRREGFLVGGVPDGRWATYHRAGGRRLAVDFVAGSPQGLCQAFDPDGELLATGAVSAGRVTGEWRVFVNGEERGYQGEEVRPPVPLGLEWTSDDVTRAQPPEAVVDLWLAEVTSAIDDDVIVRMTPPPSAQPPASWLDQEVSQKPVVPIRAQPWTVREASNMENYLRNYGTEPGAGQRSSGRYGGPKRRGKREGDVEKSQQIVGRTLPRTKFESTQGQVVDIDALKGNKRVLLLVLRGFAGQVCVYCTTQTRALAPSLNTFKDLNTEVLVLFPGPEAGLDAFLEAYTRTFGDDPPPYTLLYDPELALARDLGIVGDLAIPTTLILDEQGVIQYAYVGEDIEDRPSAKDVIEAIQQLGKP
ncbi:MAG: redoxin domain-containing protein [Planctomycetota bacterium]